MCEFLFKTSVVYVFYDLIFSAQWDILSFLTKKTKKSGKIPVF